MWSNVLSLWRYTHRYGVSAPFSWCRHFFENQLKASGLSTVRTAPYCFQKSTVYDNVLLRYVETFHVCANDYGLEEPIYCIYFGASWTGFSVITSPNRNLCGRNLDISDGPWCALTQGKWRKSPQWFRSRALKRVFCYQCNAAFRPLILHRFRPFLKQQTWIGFRMRTPMKKFPISAQGFSRSQKQPKIRYSRVGCLCAGCSSNGTIVGDRNHFGG